MSKFNIEFEEADATAEENDSIAYGRLQIGDFSERFESLTEFWSKNCYRQHWRKAIVRILELHDKSCLITSLPEPRDANFLMWWPIYRIDDRVVFHNCILFLNTIRESFDPEHPYDFVPDRETHSQDGLPISEWSIPISCLSYYLERD